MSWELHFTVVTFHSYTLVPLRLASATWAFTCPRLWLVRNRSSCIFASNCFLCILCAQI